MLLGQMNGNKWIVKAVYDGRLYQNKTPVTYTITGDMTLVALSGLNRYGVATGGYSSYP